jgi:hypothetical protein
MLSIVLERRIEMLQILNKLVGFLDEVWTRDLTSKSAAGDVYFVLISIGHT